MIGVAQLFTVGQTDHGCVKNLGTAVGSLERAGLTMDFQGYMARKKWQVPTVEHNGCLDGLRVRV